MKQITGGNIQTPGECSQAVTLFSKWQEFAALSSIAAVRIFAAILLRVISRKILADGGFHASERAGSFVVRHASHKTLGE
jgi:hypothetical protein